MRYDVFTAAPFLVLLSDPWTNGPTSSDAKTGGLGRDGRTFGIGPGRAPVEPVGGTGRGRTRRACCDYSRAEPSRLRSPQRPTSTSTGDVPTAMTVTPMARRPFPTTWSTLVECLHRRAIRAVHQRESTSECHRSDCEARPSVCARTRATSRPPECASREHRRSPAFARVPRRRSALPRLSDRPRV